MPCHCVSPIAVQEEVDTIITNLHSQSYHVIAVAELMTIDLPRLLPASRIVEWMVENKNASWSTIREVVQGDHLRMIINLSMYMHVPCCYSKFLPLCIIR